MAAPQQGGFDAGRNPAAPVAVQQTTVIQVGGQKSVVGAVLLALFFGPLGMLYATVPGALVMFVISIPIVIVTLGFGLLITLPICAIWAGVAASSHNGRLGGFATQQAAATYRAPAAWHDDPDGSGRLRYYDGSRWTDHYTEKPSAETAIPEIAAGAAAGEPELTPGADEAATEVTKVVAQGAFCGACGAGIEANDRFCPACGSPQAAS